jgi:hypothetical protein
VQESGPIHQLWTVEVAMRVDMSTKSASESRCIVTIQVHTKGSEIFPVSLLSDSQFRPWFKFPAVL